MIGVRFTGRSSYDDDWGLFLEGDADQIGAAESFPLFEYHPPFFEAALTVKYASEEADRPYINWERQDNTELGSVEILLSDDPPPEQQSRTLRVHPESNAVPGVNKLEVVSVGMVDRGTDPITDTGEFLSVQRHLEEELPYGLPRRGAYITIAALDRATPEIREAYRDAHR